MICRRAASKCCSTAQFDLTITQDLFRQGSQPLRLLADLLQKNIQPENSNKGSEISIICAQNIE